MQKSLNMLSARQELGLTQAQLADLLGITPEYVSMIEHGKKTPSRNILNKLESLLIEFKKSPSDSAGHRLSKAYDQPKNGAGSGIVSDQKNCDYLSKENEILRAELREARAVIRDQAEAIAALSRR